MKKYLLLTLFVFQVSASFCQYNRLNHGNVEGFFDGRAGVTVGVTNFITDTNLLFSKSGTGFTVGFLSTADISERAEIFISVNYSSHSTKFVGKETPTSEQEDIKFKLEEFSVPFLFNYNYLFINEDIKFGVFAGPAFHFFHEFRVKDDSKRNYLLEPLLATPNDLKFDERNEEISFNVFGSVGLSAQFRNRILAQLTYSKSITDPYRQAPIFSNFIDISGDDSIISFTMTYLFGQY